MKIHSISSAAVVLLACMPLVAQQPAEQGAEDDNKITIRDRTYEIYPPELLEARGIEVRTTHHASS